MYVKVYICIYIHIYLYLHTCKYIRTSVYICIYVHTHLHIYVNVHMSARLYESCKKIQRPDPRICPLGSGNSLVQNISVWSYWSGGNEKPTGLSNITSTAKSCAEDQILENSILGTRFLIFVLNDIQILFWNLFTSKWAFIIDWVGLICNIYTYIYMYILKYSCTRVYKYIYMWTYIYIIY